MTKNKIYMLLSVLVILAQSAHGFQLPTSYSTELARYSSIITTSTCTDGGPENCNTTCPTRTSFPSFMKTIKSISSNCSVYNDSPPTHSDIGNGGIVFNSSTTDCPLHEGNYDGNNKHFTITMWVKVSTNTNVLSIGSGLYLKYEGNKFVLQNTFRNTVSSEWYFITLRFNGKLSWFVNGIQIKTDGLSFTASSSYSVKLGPEQDLTSGSLIIVDVRWYSDVITDREIDYLYKGVKDDFCRCPPTHPKVMKDTLPVENMKCTDGSSEVLRLGSNAHIPAYMADATTTTKWVSDTVNEVNITLTLKNQFQMKRLLLVGIARSPASLKVILLLNNVEVQAMGLNVSGGQASYVFEGSISRRTQYQKIIADKVIVQAKFSTSDYLTVSELTLEARCSCYGNDNACKIVKDNYTCSCLSSSNTIGPHCDGCGTGYYRSAEQFVCNNPCKCNMTGSNDIVCEEVNGQCICHNNIEGRNCSVCQHNTANFSSSGCTACDCNPDGITSCSDDLTCNCKQNVDNTSGKCDKCLPNYYNISRPSGCADCKCDLSGTRVMEPYCESGKGECFCRANVEGKTCKTCKDEYYGLSGNKTDGCDACECNIVGSTSFICDKDTGQCPCFGESNHTEINNRQCIPTALKLEPLFGPKAGNTSLTLTGTNLGTNATVKLTIGGIEQTVVHRNLTFIVFETTGSMEIKNKPIRLVWSYGGHTYSDGNFDNTTQMFEYKNNPQMIVRTLNRRTFESGGCIIQVNDGSNLDSVPYPKLRVYLDGGKEIQSPCVATTDTLKCPTPKIDIGDKHLNVSYGFWLDGLMLYKNVTQSQGSELEVVKDPSIYTGMSETFRNTFDDLFKVKGERLNDACYDSDVSITLGDKNCAILSRHDDVITCDPGESFPGTARSVTVKVKIGNIEVEWGTLKINSFWTNTEFIYIAIGAGLFLIIVIACFVCVIRCRRKSNSDSPDDSIPLEIATTGKTKPNNYTTINPIAVIQPQSAEVHTKTSKEIADDFCKRLLHHVGKVVNSSIIERSNIDPGKVCTHKGKKIRVISGQYNASTSSPYSGSSLTIKTLIDKYPEEGDLPEWLNTGLLECTRLQDFDNDNVLRMKGIAIDTKNIYIIYPAMANKTLKEYLILEPLNADKKLEICIRVCEGMNYLSSQSIVHKDLAARNCWVSRDFEVKISDASFSYDLFPDEYLHSNGRYQPVRWMSPESLRQGFYDAKSDVWSYGVVIWEVFANGYLPYYDITDNAMIKSKVCDEHYRLGKPVDCDDAMFQIICDCQKDKSEDRPNFFIIQNMFDHILNPGASLVQYANQQELAGHETGMEDYENLGIVPPPRPPKDY